jgi:hypothetical protein
MKPSGRVIVITTIIVLIACTLVVSISWRLTRSGTQEEPSSRTEVSQGSQEPVSLAQKTEAAYEVSKATESPEVAMELQAIATLKDDLLNAVFMDDAVSKVQTIRQENKGSPFAPAENPLTGENKEIAESLLAGVTEQMQNIESLEFDMTVTDSQLPVLDMDGHVSADKIDTVRYSGTMWGKTLSAEIDCSQELAILKLDSLDKSLGKEQFVGFELLQNIWMTPFRKHGDVNVFDTVQENKSLQDAEGRDISCTIISGPQCAIAFDSSSGRLLRTEARLHGQNTVSDFTYDENSMYPSSITITFRDDDNDPGNDRTIEFQYENMNIIYSK